MKTSSNYQIVEYQGVTANIGQNVFLADNVIIAGDVTLHENCNIWFNSVIRGDVAPIIIGKNTNIQDGAVIHTSRFNNGSTIIGDNVNVGHMALLHACTILNNAFIGMQSIIMDKAIIEEYAFVGAGSLVPANKIIRSKELWMGRPAQFVRKIKQSEIDMMHDNIQNYLTLAQTYQK